MFLFLLASAAMTCPPTKSNIISPWTPTDKRAFEEHKARCQSTKTWPCVYTFEKKSDRWYVSMCGTLVENKKK